MRHVIHPTIEVSVRFLAECRGGFSRVLESASPRVAFLVVATLLAAIQPTKVSAFDLHGRVVNGTTGEPVGSASILIVNPSGGMMIENEAETDENGQFAFHDLDNSRPIFLLRVPFQGVNYTDFVRYQGQSPIDKTIEVFETTTTWDDIIVSIPHMLVSRHADTLTVEKYFTVNNKKAPPRTVAGEGARFRFQLPGNVVEINSFHVMSLGIPLPVTPNATDDPGFYTIDYPIKPGVTQIAMSFDLPYAGGQYSYEETFPLGLEEMIVVTEDPSLHITSGTTRLDRVEEAEGFFSYRIAALDADAPLQLTFAGGSDRPAPGTQSTSPQIVILPTANNAASLVVMIVLTVALIVLVVYVGSLPRSIAVEEEVLSQRREQLLDQLARLDDLHTMGTISDRMYKLKRSELTNALAQIYYRLKFVKPSKSPRTKRKKGSARV